MRWTADLLPLLHALEFCVWILAAVGLFGCVIAGIAVTLAGVRDNARKRPRIAQDATDRGDVPLP